MTPVLANVGRFENVTNYSELFAEFIGLFHGVCGADADDFPDGRLSACVFPPRAGLTSPNAADLKTLCPDCSNGSATAKFLPRMDARRLLVELRRATGADQLVIRDWLLRKYPRGD